MQVQHRHRHPQFWLSQCVPTGATVEADLSHPLMQGVVCKFLLASGYIRNLASVSDIGGIPTAVANVASIRGPVASFDGTSSFIVNTRVINLPYVSVSTWLKVSSIPITKDRLACGFVNGNGGAAFDKDILVRITSGRVRWHINNGSDRDIDSSASVCDDLWHHIVGTYDGTLNLYIDGKLANSLVTTGPSYTGYTVPNILVGGNIATGTYGYLACQQSDFSVYDRALRPDEVSELYYEPFSMLRSMARRTYSFAAPATTGSHLLPLMGVGGMVAPLTPAEVIAGAAGGALLRNPRVTRRRIITLGTDNE